MTGSRSVTTRMVKRGGMAMEGVKGGEFGQEDGVESEMGTVGRDGSGAVR